MKYIIKYRYKKYNFLNNCFKFNSDWKVSTYIANDKNDLIEKINSSIREFADFYIVYINVYFRKER